MRRSIPIVILLAGTLSITPIAAVTPVSAPHKAVSATTVYWKTFNPANYAREKDLVPSKAALELQALIYPSPPNFLEDPTKNTVVYGAGSKNPPTEMFARMRDPVLIGGKVYIASAVPGSATTIKTGAGITRLWSVTPYTPLASYSHIANPGLIEPFDPRKCFRSSRADNDWQDVIYVEPQKEITIFGQEFTGPEAGSTVVVSPKDTDGKVHKIALIGLTATSMLPPDLTGTSSASEKSASTKSSTDTLSSKPSSAPSPTANATPPSKPPVALDTSTPAPLKEGTKTAPSTSGSGASGSGGSSGAGDAPSGGTGLVYTPDQSGTADGAAIGKPGEPGSDQVRLYKLRSDGTKQYTDSVPISTIYSKDGFQRYYPDKDKPVDPNSWTYQYEGFHWEWVEKGDARFDPFWMLTPNAIDPKLSKPESVASNLQKTSTPDTGPGVGWQPTGSESPPPQLTTDSRAANPDPSKGTPSEATELGEAAKKPPLDPVIKTDGSTTPNGSTDQSQGTGGSTPSEGPLKLESKISINDQNIPMPKDGPTTYLGDNKVDGIGVNPSAGSQSGGSGTGGGQGTGSGSDVGRGTGGGGSSDGVAGSDGTVVGGGGVPLLVPPGQAPKTVTAPTQKTAAPVTSPAATPTQIAGVPIIMPTLGATPTPVATPSSVATPTAVKSYTPPAVSPPVATPTPTPPPASRPPVAIPTPPPATNPPVAAPTPPPATSPPVTRPAPTPVATPTPPPTTRSPIDPPTLPATRTPITTPVSPPATRSPIVAPTPPPATRTPVAAPAPPPATRPPGDTPTPPSMRPPAATPMTPSTRPPDTTPTLPPASSSPRPDLPPATTGWVPKGLEPDPGPSTHTAWHPNPDHPEPGVSSDTHASTPELSMTPVTPVSSPITVNAAEDNAAKSKDITQGGSAFLAKDNNYYYNRGGNVDAIPKSDINNPGRANDPVVQAIKSQIDGNSPPTANSTPIRPAAPQTPTSSVNNNPPSAGQGSAGETRAIQPPAELTPTKSFSADLPPLQATSPSYSGSGYNSKPLSTAPATGDSRAIQPLSTATQTKSFSTDLGTPQQASSGGSGNHDIQPVQMQQPSTPNLVPSPERAGTNPTSGPISVTPSTTSAGNPSSPQSPQDNETASQRANATGQASKGNPTDASKPEVRTPNNHGTAGSTSDRTDGSRRGDQSKAWERAAEVPAGQTGAFSDDGKTIYWKDANGDKGQSSVADAKELIKKRPTLAPKLQALLSALGSSPNLSSSSSSHSQTPSSSSASTTPGGSHSSGTGSKTASGTDASGTWHQAGKGKFEMGDTRTGLNTGAGASSTSTSTSYTKPTTATTNLLNGQTAELAPNGQPIYSGFNVPAATVTGAPLTGFDAYKQPIEGTYERLNDKEGIVHVTKGNFGPMSFRVYLRH